MKKILLSLLAILIYFSSCGQNKTAPKFNIKILQDNTHVAKPLITNFKLVVTGDSHTVDTPPGGSSVIWVNQYRAYLAQFYDTVTLVNLGIGGTTTRSLMPSWYGGTNLSCNIDAVLSQNPDLVILSSSGNSTVVLQLPADSSIKHFSYLADTLNKLGIRFILTGQDARKKTFTPPITAQSYHDTSTRINNWMIANYPKSYANTYKYDYDNIIGLRPWDYVLKSDSLHKSDYGHSLYLQAHLDCAMTDSVLSGYKASVEDFSLKKSGSNVVLKGSFTYNTITVYGSNDLSTFNTLQTFTADNERIKEQINETFSYSSYSYIKIVVYGKRLSKTITLSTSNL